MCVRHLHIYWDAVTIRHLCSLPLLVSFGGSCGLLHRLRTRSSSLSMGGCRCGCVNLRLTFGCVDLRSTFGISYLCGWTDVSWNLRFRIHIKCAARTREQLHSVSFEGLRPARSPSWRPTEGLLTKPRRAAAVQWVEAIVSSIGYTQTYLVTKSSIIYIIWCIIYYIRWRIIWNIMCYMISSDTS